MIFPVRAGDLAGAVRVGGQGPAQLVQQYVVVPPAVVLEVSEAGAPAVGPVDHVVRLASGGGLIAAAGVLAGLVPQRDQAAQVHRDVVGLADVQRKRRAVQALAEQVTAQERGHSARTGDDLQDLAQDLLLQPGQRLGHCGGLLRPGCAAGQPGRDRSVGPDAVVADAQDDQVLYGVGVDIAGDDRDDHRVARDGAGLLALQPRAAVPGTTDAAARWAAHRARYSAIHLSCSAESASISHSSAKEMCTRALTGCPARLGSRSEASSRRIASSSASWYAGGGSAGRRRPGVRTGRPAPPAPSRRTRG